MNYVLLPVPAEVLDELELDEFSTVQYLNRYFRKKGSNQLCNRMCGRN